MMQIRYVQAEDEFFWFRLDKHLPKEGFLQKIRDKQGYVLLNGGTPAALLRYNLFWDTIPFCTLLYVKEGSRQIGCGRALLDRWERDMKKQGYDMVMTSSQSDEAAQHFYRKLGYRDAGVLLLDSPGYEQPAELFFIKEV